MKKEHIFVIILVILIAGITALAVFTNKKNNVDANPALTTAITTVAQALKASGVKFYGASWCSHCAEQKVFFKSAVKELPYIECSTGGAGSPQTQICIDAKIESYPTWEFAPNIRGTLVILPIDLAEIIGMDLNETDKTELQLQKDEVMLKFNDKQKESYITEIKKLIDQVSALKK